MSLSDRERRLLAEMEAALATDDPRLQTTLTEGRTSRLRARPLTSALIILGGIAILFSGLIAQITALGVAGFIVALVGLLSLINSAGQASVRTPRRSTRQSSLRSRLEERWERRNFER